MVILVSIFRLPLRPSIKIEIVALVLSSWPWWLYCAPSQWRWFAQPWTWIAQPWTWLLIHLFFKNCVVIRLYFFIASIKTWNPSVLAKWIFSHCSTIDGTIPLYATSAGSDLKSQDSKIISLQILVASLTIIGPTRLVKNMLVIFIQRNIQYKTRQCEMIRHESVPN